ncbi:MAG: hypothetical protein EA374_01010 [Acholeplasmatales bacterium]|nr:MAG: hypothetical protein EA374_01010 [Acholeplasmatales bacterium]
MMNYDFGKDAMLSFSNYNEFWEFYHSLNIPRWHISTGLLNDRGKYIENRSYTHRLRTIFNEKKLFRRNVAIAEIVSWLDSYLILRRLLHLLRGMLKEDVLMKMKIHCEYRIEMSKNRRVDFIFEYADRILLAEFRLSDKFPNVSNMWQKKELELIIYKELLGNYLPTKVKVLIFAFIGMPEIEQGQMIEKNIKYNEENIEFFARYITQYLFQQGN